MKMIVLIFTMLTAFVVNADIGPVGRSASLDNAGTLKAGSLDKFFINVKNSSAIALVAGDVVILDLSDDDGYSVDTTTSASQRPHCVANEAAAVGAMFRCQTYGLRTDCNFTPDQNNAVAGSSLFISESQAGKMDAITSPAATDYAIGMAYDAASASGDVECFIDLR